MFPPVASISYRMGWSGRLRNMYKSVKNKRKVNEVMRPIDFQCIKKIIEQN